MARRVRAAREGAAPPFEGMDGTTVGRKGIQSSRAKRIALSASRVGPVSTSPRNNMQDVMDDGDEPLAPPEDGVDVARALNDALPADILTALEGVDAETAATEVRARTCPSTEPNCIAPRVPPRRACWY